MRLWISLFSVLFLIACQNEGVSNRLPENPIPPSRGRIKSAFESRIADSNFHSLEASFLGACLPQVFAPYQKREIEQSDFSSRFTEFSQSRGIYTLEEGQYLSLQISDYGRDSSAFLHLFHQYLYIEEAPLPLTAGRKISVPLDDAFAWSWKDNQSGLAYLEAGVFRRFHVQIRTNRMTGIIVLEDAFKRIDWERLEKEIRKRP